MLAARLLLELEVEANGKPQNGKSPNGKTAKEPAEAEAEVEVEEVASKT